MYSWTRVLELLQAIESARLRAIPSGRSTMAWILFLLAVACFILLCFAKSVAFGFVCMVMALIFLLASIMKFLGSRIDSSSRDGGNLLSPDELRRIREHAATKLGGSSVAEFASSKQEQQPAVVDPPGPPSTTT
jgi:hypothetical protein